jgi:hypothetical protein
MAQGTCGVGGCDRPGEGATIRRRYTFNETFFDVIDTEAKAYWLGFIGADGCVTGGQRPNRLTVKLMESDTGHLEKLKAALGANHPLLHEPRRGVAGASAGLTVASPHLIRSLAELGIVPRKSTILVPWNGPRELMRHYWRGMFDGDGCIGKSADRDNWSLTLCGSETCILAFAEWARQVCGSTSVPYFRSNIWNWKAGGLASPQALARELYEGSTVYLDRKHELAVQLMGKPILARSWRGQECAKNGCDAEATVMGMCQTHYAAHWRATADHPECVMDDCHEPQIANEYCTKHYRRDRKHGDPSRVDQGREGARRHALDESFFNEIDTPEKARWLGFVAAVASVVRSTKTFQVRMELNIRDEGFLVRLRDALGTDKPLRYRSGPKVGDLAGLTVDSWRMTEALEGHGVTTRSGMTVTPWNGPDDLMPHYRQGFAEGQSVSRR